MRLDQLLSMRKAVVSIEVNRIYEVKLESPSDHQCEALMEIPGYLRAKWEKGVRYVWIADTYITEEGVYALVQRALHKGYEEAQNEAREAQENS